MTFKDELIETLDKYKCKDKLDYLILIPIYGEFEILAYLRPITKDFLVSMPTCVELLSRWREENPTLSPARFKITNERTREWIENLVINNNRIIFMIQSLRGEYLGHIGFAAFDFEKRQAEVDSVLKGVKKHYPRLMEYTIHTLITWGKEELKLEHIMLEVLSDNERAINFYKRCGFVEQNLIPLEKIELPDEIKWQPYANIKAAQRAEKYFLQMKYC